MTEKENKLVEEDGEWMWIVVVRNEEREEG